MVTKQNIGAYRSAQCVYIGNRVIYQMIHKCITRIFRYRFWLGNCTKLIFYVVTKDNQIMNGIKY